MAAAAWLRRRYSACNRHKMTATLPAGPRRLRPSFWMNASYFWYFAGIGSFGPYIALYYRQLQLSGLQIGLLAAILPLGVATLAPLWGGLADSYSAHRLALRAAMLMAAGLALGVARAAGFAALLPLVLLLAACLAAIPALLDSYAVMIAEREGTSYGQLRVWGTVGYIGGVWAVAALMGQAVTERFLYIYAATLLLACGATIGLPALQDRSTQRLWQGIAAIVRDRSVLALLLTVYLIVCNVSIIGGFLGIYLTELGGDVRLVGTASSLAAVSELPVMILGSRLIRRHTSYRVLVFAVAIFLLRLLLFSIPPDVSWVVAVQLLHGISFGLYLMASVTLMHELAGRARAATAQGLLGATAQGFAAVTGSLAGGVLLDRVGALGLFRAAALGMGLALIVCLFSVGYMRARAAPTQQA